MDGEFGFSVEEATLVKFNLFVGKELDNTDIEQMENQDQIEYLYNKALGIIARRPRSKNEIKVYLEKKSKTRFKKVEETVVGEVIAKLESRKHLDDKAFAKWFVDSRLKMQKHSIYQIRNELNLKFGVDKELTQLVLEEAEASNKELATIEHLIDKKFRQYQLKHKDKRIAKEKMSQYLSNKGFSWDAVNKVIDN